MADVSHDRAGAAPLDLKRLLAPASIAVVGASERASVGRTILESLRVLGFRGAIHPVHPRHETILGHRCLADLSEVPAGVDLVAICLAAERVTAEIEKAAAVGAGAAVIFAGGFAEAGEEGRRRQRRVVDVCREAGIALCGPNCMGVMNPRHGSHAYMMDVLDPERIRGDVGFVSQSGSVTINMLADTRRYGFSHVVSTGNEAVASTARFMDYLIDDPGCRVVATFTESIREPERYVAALDRAADAGKPVVVLKAGKSARAAAAVRTHTGGMAGESRVFSALLEAHRAIEVDDLEEMAEVLAVLQGSRRPEGDRIAVVTGSGGHAELFLDLAAARGVDLPPLPAAARAAVEAQVGPLTGDGNPIDAWGRGDFVANFGLAMAEAARCGAYDAVVLSLDANDGQAVDYRGQDKAVVDLLRDAATAPGPPLFLMSTRHGVLRGAQAEAIRGAGVPTITGMAQGLKAIGLVARWRKDPGRASARRPAPARETPAWAGRVTVHEADAKRLLSEAGVPVTRERLAAGPDEAVEAAEAIGYPVVMKAMGDRVPHRSEHGLVALGLADAGAVADAWTALTRRLGPLGADAAGAGIAVQETAPPGVEVIAGVARDPAFGLVLAVGPGGVLAELFDEARMACLPLRDGDIDALISGGRLAGLLAGFRGSGPADTAALADALRSLAAFALAHESWIEGVDVNPLIVHEDGGGCVAADALIVPRRGRASRSGSTASGTRGDGRRRRVDPRPTGRRTP